jgi:tetratricopeptide (TPR) repeat protein
MVMRLLALTLLVWVTGCGVRVSNEASSGRTALLTGKPEDAVVHFKRGVESQPDYVIDTPPLRQSIWSYLGRAYYSTGQFGEAKMAFSRALQLDGGDFLARLYLGLISLRESTPQTTAKGDNSFGVNEIFFALKEKISPRRLAALVKERGANFELTAELEKELRRAGADDELVGQVRASSRLRANAAPVQPGVREIERALKEIQSWQVGVRKTDVGRTWDSRKQISSRVDTGLSLISTRRTDRPEFVAALETLGRVIDEEVDQARSK